MPLNVIALISGGKDSLYSLAHCLQHGHRIVALANLHPVITTKSASCTEEDDMDSFMYQTVGHSVVPLYAEALQLPLYRRSITGQAQQTGRYYDASSATTNQDETEDMFLLVQNIVQQHPEATGLTAGAILSTYQRTRVESVAMRLNLTPLAYLWQYPLLPPPSYREDSLTGLLEDMHFAGCDARIIKIASGGIPSDLLAKNVTDQFVASRLINGLAPFFIDHEDWLRGSVLGEGGEYETIALNGPTQLWKHKIELNFLGSRHGEGGTQYSVFTNGVLKDGAAAAQNEVPTPTLFDPQFKAIFRYLSLQQSTGLEQQLDVLAAPEGLYTTTLESRHTIQLANLISIGGIDSPTRQLEAIIIQLKKQLTDMSQGHCRQISTSSIISVTMVVRSMSDFTALNSIYVTQLWPVRRPNPPARVTIAAPLPPGVHVSLSLQIDASGDETVHKGLHVQSLSYWAPANIGPYSQAISTILPGELSADHSGALAEIEVVHMAGQIPLLPSTMHLLDGTLNDHAVLALQHLWRIGQERGVDTWAGAGVAYLNASCRAGQDLRACAEIACSVWRLAHSIDSNGNIVSAHREDDVEQEDDDVDVWEMKNLQHGFGSFVQPTVGMHLHVLPNHSILKQSLASRRCSDQASNENVVCPIPFVAAVVNDLPRGAPIEWWSTGIAGIVQASKSGQVQVAVFQRTSEPGVTVKVMEISHELKRHDSGSHAQTAAHRSYFAAVSVAASGDDKHLHAAIQSTNNVAKLLNLEADTISEMVNCHTFINLRSKRATHTLLKSVKAVHHGAIIHCHQLWSDLSPDGSAAFSDGGPSQGLREAAMILICRFDVFSGS